MPRRRISPVTLVQRFSLALTIIALVTALTMLVAMRNPHLGLLLELDADAGTVLVSGSSGPAAEAGIPSGSRMISIATAADPTDAILLEPLDLIDEPDTLDYATYDRFVDRQGELNGMLSAGPVAVTVAEPGRDPRSVVAQATAWRPISALPFAFWYQIACAVIICVIGAWVQCLSPRDGKVRFFAFAGYGVALAVFSAAAYSTRELALSEPVFRSLTILNNIGAMSFGIGMIGLFARYPVDLKIARLTNGLIGLFVLWIFATHLRIFYDVGLGTVGYLGILCEMIAIIVLTGAQYVATRRDLPARRALTWLGVSVILGAGAFVLLVAVPLLVGLNVVLPQGYAFGFFVLIYLGVALGLTRYRLFELDRWAFSIFTYVLAAFLFAAIDFTLIGMLALTPAVSLGITAVLVGLLYLPVRNFLMARYLARKELDPLALYRASTEIALQTSGEARAERWRQALVDYFEPLHADTPEDVGQRPVIGDDGATLVLPAYDWSPPLRLRHPKRGRALFGAPHLAVVEDFARLVAAAEEQRDAYDRGVKEERGRIGRDLHDSVGARLLSSLRATDDTDARQMVRNALGDIREIVGGLSDRRETLANIIAELRAETMERLDDGTVEWPLSEADRSGLVLPYLVFRNFTSAHRELVTNVIKHAPGADIAVTTELLGDRLVHTVENTLPGTASHENRRAFSGNGLENIAARARQTGGQFDYQVTPKAFIATISLPVAIGAVAA